MKKSLSKILARMAKDGDIETVAEIIEEMMEPETPSEAAAEAVAETVAAKAAEAAAEAAEDPAAVVETPEGTTVVVDESTLADIVSRLDKLIELLTPAPAADEDPVAEEVAEVIEEALEAAEAEAAEEPAAEILSEGIRPEEVAEIVGEILDPAETGTGDPLLDECEEEEQEVLSTGDALRAALTAVRPALAKMPRKQRQRVCADIAARMKRGGRKPAGRRAADAGTYAALSAMRRSAARPDEKELGRRIMASRNINCRK